ncbi:MAG: hypothetical protein KGM47_12540 [Acidobacteriota bacterium]|nr:hypothetical protein [Acidobacteriota bacterium]
MTSVDLNSVLASRDYYPVNLDLRRRVIWFAEIDREAYRRAGFLVPKQARMSEERYGFNLDDVLLYDLSLPIGGAASHYIFISAFCCSTLLARLLDRVPDCMVLKEPSILGQLGMLRYRPRKSGDETSPLQRATRAGEDTAAAKDEHPTVIPAQAGIQGWTPACVGRRTLGTCAASTEPSFPR